MTAVDLGYDFDAHVAAYRKRQVRKSKWKHVPGSYRQRPITFEVAQ